MTRYNKPDGSLAWIAVDGERVGQVGEVQGIYRAGQPSIPPEAVWDRAVQAWEEGAEDESVRIAWYGEPEAGVVPEGIYALGIIEPYPVASLERAMLRLTERWLTPAEVQEETE